MLDLMHKITQLMYTSTHTLDFIYGTNHGWVHVAYINDLNVQTCVIYLPSRTCLEQKSTKACPMDYVDFCQNHASGMGQFDVCSLSLFPNHNPGITHTHQHFISSKYNIDGLVQENATPVR